MPFLSPFGGGIPSMILSKSSKTPARQDKRRQGKTKTRQDKDNIVDNDKTMTRQRRKMRQDKTGQDKTRRDKTRQGKTRQDEIR
jgi:hypothetical protein